MQIPSLKNGCLLYGEYYMVARKYEIYFDCVEQDISRVSEANELDILLSTRNKLHISKHPCIILCLFQKNLNFYCKQSR